MRPAAPPLVAPLAEPAAWFAGLSSWWEAIVSVSGIQPFVLPAPVGLPLGHRRGARPPSPPRPLITTRMVIYGFLAGAIPGIVHGYLIARSAP